MPVRVLVTITAPSAEAADAAIADRVEHCRHVEAEEEGCLQYEIFRSTAAPNRWVLCELWSSKAIYDKHWKLQQEREKLNPPKPPAPPKPGEPPRRSTVEFYVQQVFQVVDGIWTAADPEERSETVRWMR
jgi:quinol monooxygenase YgiN